MTDYAELERRLRDFDNEGITNSDRFHLRMEGADALAAQRKRIAELEAVLRDVAHEVGENMSYATSAQILERIYTAITRKP